MGCDDDTENPSLESDVQIAFMPDIHFHDVYGDFEDFPEHPGLTGSTERPAYIRSMAEQLGSTRLFNENYFALIAALDDVVERGIKHVALPGDFSDDGQPVHMRGFVEIINHYKEKHGLRFYAAPGNHDPINPIEEAAGDVYLGENGQEQQIKSLAKDECAQSDGSKGQPRYVDQPDGLPTVCTDDIRGYGYEGIMEVLADDGFYPQPDYLYYETPFSSQESRTDYSYDRALIESRFNNRQIEICSEGSGGIYKESSYTNCTDIADTSYLVEPIKGIWVLAIDANVYIPEGEQDGQMTFGSASSAGYNKMVTHKKRIIDWMTSVATRAKEEGKILISFSHFPMTDFYEGASEDLEDLFGEGSNQLARVPEDDVSRALAETGVAVHVGGHMHFNDTGKKSYQIDGQQYTLFNIQAPSLGAYIPAYKILTISPQSQIEVETVVVDEVPRFDELFDYYTMEHEYLTDNASTPEERDSIWNIDVLSSANYHEFTDWHLKELTRLNFVPNEWPLDMQLMIKMMSGDDMLILSQLQTDTTLCELADYLGYPLGQCNPANYSSTFEEDWEAAKAQAELVALEAGLTLDDFASWTAEELAVDFFRLRNADGLALRDIDEVRLESYSVLTEQLSQIEVEVSAQDDQLNDIKVSELFKTRFSALFNIMKKFSTGEPSDRFLIDLEQQTLSDLSNDAAESTREQLQ
ncbi:metallophosphoesterase [Vibrio sp. SCSIO 43135]|uniref:metallophosphoesterase family protein n=1 Tax=Vibrio sp. SCSIO 43135 TaxID=2819096 RepID=UPI002076677D|nr:metallophosphoesterase [Vibrio sp. SCSIO 43135]